MKKLIQGIFTLVLAVIVGTTFGQLSKGGIPYSFSRSVESANIDKIQTITPDLNIIAQQDAINDASKAYRVGINIPVNINTSNSGSWQILPNGGKLWRLQIEANNAKAIGLYYHNFFIPDGGKVFLYNQNKKQVIGAYTSEYNFENTIRATQMVQGDVITIEYYAQPGTIGQPIIEIKDVVYFYRGVQDFISPYLDEVTEIRAADCQVDVNCSPEGDNWVQQRDAVIHYTFVQGGNTYVCSASMLNNTAQDCTPYVLSAWHCGEPAAGTNISSWVWYWNYQKATCAPGAANGSDPAKGTNTMTGGTVLASSANGTANNPPAAGDVAGSDFYLVQLSSTPPTNYNAFYAGWDRSGNTISSGVGIHHPDGSAKKISTYSSSLISTTYNSGWANAHWQVTWAATTNGHGVTEGGSSGSPIFDQNKRVVGQLSGGSSFCTTPTAPDLYGKFRNDWDMSGTANNAQLKPWLDPTNSGVLTVDGAYEPCNANNPPVCGINASATSTAVGGTVNFQDGSSSNPTTWNWNFDNTAIGGASPSTSTVANPGDVTFNNIGTYEIQLIASNVNGTCTTTVNVNVTASTGCDTLLNITSTDTLRLYGANGGYLAGWNGYGDVSKCEKYTGYAPYNFINGFAIYMAIADGGNGASVDFNVWDDNAGMPGTIIGTVSYPVSDLATALAGNGGLGILNINFPTAVNAGGNDFYIGFTMNGFGAGDSLGVVSNSLYDPTPNTAYEQWADLTWYDIQTAWGNPLSLYISPYVTDAPVSGSASSNTTTVCEGGSIDFTSSATNATGYTWYFPGGTPATATTQNATATYATAGTYTAYLVLDGACSGQVVDSITNIVITSGPVVSSTTTDPTCTNNDGQITVSATGGTPTYQFSIDGGVTFQASGNFTGLSAGAYNLVVNDASSCSGTNTATLTISGGLTVNATPTQPSCANNDGQIVVSASGGQTPYTYSIDNGVTFQTGDTFTGLTAGPYDIVSQDANGCQGTSQIVLTASASNIVVSLTPNNPNCGMTDGSIDVAATGGTPTYTYSIDNGVTYQAGTTFTGLGIGTYTITAMDANGCTGSDQTTLVEPNAPTASATGTAVICNGNADGTITAAGTGGTPAYSYSLDGVLFQGGATFSGLSASNYTVYVRDQNGCTGTTTYSVTEPAMVTFTATVQDEQCGMANGSITINATGGDGTFNYSIDNGTTSQTGNVFSGLSANSYQVIVTDNSGCSSAMSTSTVNNGGNVIVSSTPTNETCGQGNGQIDLVATGGTAPYNYSIDGGTTTQTSGSFTGLSAGNFDIVVSDANGCSSTPSTVTLSNNGTVSMSTNNTNETCNASNGVIDITGNGGAAPYQYSIDGGTTYQSSGVFNNISSGSYNIAVQDANGCVANNIATITNTGGVNSSISPTQNICAGNTATITASGAGSGGTYAWDNGLGSGSTQNVSPSTTTTYTCVITDAFGCSATESVIVNVTAIPVVAVTPASATICKGSSVTLTASGATSYNWVTTGESTAAITVSPLSNTTYNVVGMNGNCSGSPVSAVVTVEQSPIVTGAADRYIISSGETVNFNNFGSTASTVSWNFGDGSNASTQPTPSHTYSAVGTYTVILTGTLGNCTGTDTLTIMVGYSDITELNLEKDVVLYPNPNAGTFNIGFDLSERKDIDLVIMNAVGQIVTTARYANMMNSLVAIDLSKEETGLYFVNINTGAGQITKVISVIR